MEEAQKKKAVRRLSRIVGAQLIRIYRGADMPGLMFSDAKGVRTAIHCFSRLVITENSTIIIDSDDIYEPSAGTKPRSDLRYEIGESVYDTSVQSFNLNMPLVVESVEVKDDGVIRIKLEKGFWCCVIPWQGDIDEVWRIFTPHRGRHLVYYGNGVLKTE